MKNLPTLRTVSVAFTVLGATLVASSAGATVVTYSPFWTNLFGTTAAQRPELAGTIIADTMRPFTLNVNGTIFTGEVQDRVVQETSKGTLDFYYRVIMDKQSSFNNFGVARSSFTGFTTDIDSRLDGVGDVFPYLGGYVWQQPSEIGFQYAGGFTMAPGSAGSTRFSFVKTNATAYVASGTLTIYASLPNVALSPMYSVSIPCYEPTTSRRIVVAP